jgi:4-amino-4-deoxy-L-arabinose transferase-like glycosyltransferase
MIERRATQLAFAFAALYFVVLWITAPAMGFVRDESYYFKAAEEYGRWWEVLFSSRFFEAFTDAEILKHFSYNTEHPALVKITQGIGERVLHDWLGIASESQAYRATGFLFAALSFIATFLLGRLMVSASAGLLAAILLVTMPRYFYDAHLACFDVPMTAMWTFSLWAFWRALEADVDRGKKAITAGIIFGLSLATKLNALFLPIVFVLIWISRGALRGFALERAPSGGRDLRLPAIPWVLIACALIGPIVFYVHWPYLWNHPFQRTGAYIGFHLHHEHYPISYFHDLLVKPPFPWSFPIVMTIFTVPAPVLILGTLGFCVSAWRVVRRRSSSELLLVFSAFLPIFLIAMPSTPIFGGVKHWYNALPTFSILAARSILEGAEAVAKSDRLRPAIALAFGVLAALPGIFGMAASHPNGIGFYNEIAGGHRGGAELGMQRMFWGGLGDPLYPMLFELPERSYVFFNRSTYDSYRMHQREGTLPKDVYYANDAKGLAAAGLLFQQPEHGEKAGDIWSSIGTRPVAGIYTDEVSLVELYVRGKSDRAP